MEQEPPRKASDVLLALESKIESLLGILRNQDLKIGIISNKLNAVMELIRKAPATPVAAPTFSAEAINEISFPSYQNKEISVSSEESLPLESNPKGFRRTSRPESYAGDHAVLPKPKVSQKPPSGRSNSVDIIVPPQAIAKPAPIEAIPTPPAQEQTNKNAIPVVQRVVDRNGKSVFLADVEIIDLTANQSVFKTRTNGTGKWMASLAPNHYKVLIRKVESLTKERVETPQDIVVDGTKSPLELPTLIIK